MTSWALSGRVVSSGRDLGPGWVAVDGPTVTGVGAGRPPAGAIDLGARLVVPGFVDLHVHGGGGHQFAGDSPAEVAAEAAHVARHHVRHGTTTLLATTVTDTPERLRTVVAGLGSLVGVAVPGAAAIAGIHLEGPWLSPARAGAHPPALLRPPDPAELATLVAASGGTVRLVTYAPELPGADALLAAGLAAGITLSVGHTDADHDVARAAFAAGARHVTHLGNAMPPLDRRAPGPLGAALAADAVTLEVIADGHHLHPGLLALVAAVARERMVAVTDAVAACGMPPGAYDLAGTRIVVDDGRVALASDPATLAGSGLTMDRAVATLVSAGVDLATAVLAATATPAGRLGAAGKGHLRPGADADLVVLDDDLSAVATVIGGRVAWDPAGLLEPVSR